MSLRVLALRVCEAVACKAVVCECEAVWFVVMRGCDIEWNDVEYETIYGCW